MIRVLIADDHAIMREGLKQLFALVDDLIVVGEAESGIEVLDQLRAGGIDLLLLDMSMPGIAGEDLIARVHTHYPLLPILVLSMHNETQIAQRALKAGALGYLTKDRDPEALLTAIRRVVAGAPFIDPQLAEQMALEASGFGQRADHDDLTRRELQILRLLARGLSVNQIATELAISNKTVSTHKARLMEKMGFSSNADLIRYSIAHKIV
ncbi:MULTISPECIES: response regulator [Pseudomonas]|jgi:DNA-binding NarL/FixJ family response regulator|uniref:DNA-binding response regulator, NarL/FixJ family, contains REC and HTH domains n=1 Tax=Pseudomonas indica TaxID=137658 RepID=A0A1G9ADH5_9PSED|nr:MULTISPECIES: response regulator transcription factor [Pseudomonas]MBU3056172.1 response regulator transcription factor [Pseudomonas indica]PAU65229.1 DNA-binding response regulator [Pseudomonas indica]PAU66314.1 DNA-binding response regulator [Pseudomonas sp. PIC25]SDK24570.1 DNA-binding response regulator, NarL/FixJ family, contains REC and HTH domains [Pseudomonas indica]